MVKKLDAIKIYEIADSGNTGLEVPVRSTIRLRCCLHYEL